MFASFTSTYVVKQQENEIKYIIIIIIQLIIIGLLNYDIIYLKIAFEHE